jgi:tetratricopeptide (TPR) repeat protein
MLQISKLKKLALSGAENLAEILAQEQHRTGDILPLSAQQTKIQLGIKESMMTLENTMYEGLNNCILALERCQNPPLKKEAVILEIEKCLQSVKSEEDFTQLSLCIFQEKSWKQQLGISNMCMHSLYEGAKTLFEEKKYGHAEKAFFMICSIDPTQEAYWIGLGHSSFQVQNYQQAIRAYSMADAINQENSWPHIWAANCFEKEYDFDSAKLALNEALLLQKTKTPENIDLILILEERLKKNKTK